MPRISDFMMLARQEQHTLYIARRCVSAEELPMFIPAAFKALAEHLEDMGGLLADHPYVAYGTPDKDGFAVEAGIAVCRALPGKNEIMPGVLPACKTVRCMYLGDYAAMEPVYREMLQWMDNRGLAASGTVYEYYFNGPPVAPENYLIAITIPVA